ncbi:MAG: TauD/TfdA dioxygenase family protein [Ilumatobacteraceae bacterium]
MPAFEIEAIDAAFGAVVDGVEIRELDDETFRAVHDAWVEHGLLVFPGQHLTRPEQDDFARRFGDLEFEATPLTNIRRDGSLRGDPDDPLVQSLRGNEGWHHDSTYMPVQAKGAVFSAEVVPTIGGDTGFADMRAAYDALDDSTRTAVADLRAHHSRRYSMERAGNDVSPDDAGRYQLYGYDVDEPPLRPLVKVHPDTGRPNLLIGQHAYGIEGLDDEESAALLDRLNADACAPPRTYFHAWTEGDVVLWDNRRLMHCATPHDPGQPRRMWHTRIAGDPATEAAINHPN